MKSDKRRSVPEAPGHLSERSRGIWNELVRDRCDSLERQVLLEHALADLDRADVLKLQIAVEGITQTSTRSGLTRIHPALKVETELRRRFLAAWRTLGLTWSKR